MAKVALLRPVMRAPALHRTPAVLLATSAVLVMAAALAGCDDTEKQLDKAKQEVGEFAVRNAAAVAGSAAFYENGHPLDKRLTCRADITSDNKATLTCTGTTKDGKPVTLDGTADGDSVEKGSYVGKVDGQEVFSKDCLDC
jgi:hypothetical protein